MTAYAIASVESHTNGTRSVSDIVTRHKAAMGMETGVFKMVEMIVVVIFTWLVKVLDKVQLSALANSSNK